MKRAKTLGIASLIATTALVGSVLLVPRLFREQLTERATRIVSRSLGTPVTVGRASVGLWRSFPRVDVRLTDVRVQGSAPYEDSELLTVDALGLHFDLIDVIGGDYTARGLYLEHPVVTAIAGEDGVTNYDLGKDEPKAPQDGIAVLLDDVKVENMQVSWTDEAAKLMVGVDDIHLTGNGTVRPDRIEFATSTQVADLSVLSSGDTWVHQIRIEATGDVVYGLDDGRVVLDAFEGSVNELPVALTATLRPTPDAIGTELDLSAPDATVEGLISLIPASWRGELDAMEATGDVALTATANGDLDAASNLYPAFSLGARVSDGSVAYAALPQSVSGLGLDLQVDHEAGPLETTTATVEQARFAMGASYFRASGTVAEPFGDPLLSFDVDTDLDLETVRRAVPIEGFTGVGRIQADVRGSGRTSAFMTPDPDGLSVEGSASAADLTVKSELVPLPVQVQRADITFDPKAASVRDLVLRFGDSDLRGTAELENFLGYALGGDTLTGSADLQSDVLDLTPFMAEPDAPEATAVLQVPPELDLRGSLTAGEVRLEDWTLTDVRGRVHADRGILNLEGLDLNVAGGRATARGTYQAVSPEEAAIDMDLTLADLRAVAAVEQFDLASRVFPAGLLPQGTFGGRLKVAGTLDPTLAIEPSSVNGSGALSAAGVTIEPDVLDTAARRLGRSELSTVRLGTGQLTFAVDDGRLALQPVNVGLGGVDSRLVGAVGLGDQALDVTLTTDVPTSAVTDRSLLEGLPAQLPGTIPVGIRVGGSIPSPTLDLDLSGARDVAADLAKQAVRDAREKLLEEADAVREEAIAEARERAEAILARAERAANRVRAEADRQADRLIAEASGNPLLKAAAERAAKKVRSEADERADRLLAEAREQVDELQ